MDANVSFVGVFMCYMTKIALRLLAYHTWLWIEKAKHNWFKHVGLYREESIAGHLTCLFTVH